MDAKGHLEQLLLLLGMRVLQARRDRRANVTAGVHDVLAIVVLGVVEQRLDARLRKAPGTGVQRLLLAPDDGLGIGVLVEVLLELLPREGVQLLNASDGDVVDFVVGPVLVQRGPDLTRAQDDAVNLLGRLDGALLVLRVRNDPLELSLGRKFSNVRAGQRVAEKSLGEEDDQGFRRC